jgi:NO-binding membrane sensor protein with MHYT domain
MHYTGKLALKLPVALLLDWRLVLLSLLISIIGSGATLLVTNEAFQVTLVCFLWNSKAWPSPAK